MYLVAGLQRYYSSTFVDDITLSTFVDGGGGGGGGVTASPR